jgi:hypothetical protein
MKQVTVHTPHGVFTSASFPEEELVSTHEILVRVSDMSDFRMPTDQGSVYLPNSMIQQSVFVIEDATNV